jgi:acyl dehydratase
MPTFDEIQIGEEIPPLERQPGRLELVLFAAGSGDFNPLHFDPDHPQAREIGDNIVHGRLKYAALGELVVRWLAHTGRIRSITAQYRGIDRRGRRFICRGTVVSKQAADRSVDVDIWTEDDQGNRTTRGRAVVVLQR